MSGVDVELAAGLFVDLASEAFEFPLHLAAGLLENACVYQHSYPLHLEQYLHQRQLDLPVERVESHFLQSLTKLRRELKCEVRGLERAEILRIETFRGLSHLNADSLSRYLEYSVRRAIGIEQITGQHRIVVDAFNANSRFEVLYRPVGTVWSKKFPGPAHVAV